MRKRDGVGGEPFRLQTGNGVVRVASRADVETLPEWAAAFARVRKDRRYYELVEDTLAEDVEYRYFVVEDGHGRVRAVQPFFLRELDLAAGAGSRLQRALAFVRRALPRLLRVRALMVGCVAGEAHLPVSDERDQAWLAECLHDALLAYARAARARLVVLKEFPSNYRRSLACFVQNGYTRVPSFPMARLNIAFASFEQWASRTLSRSARKSLRRNLRKADALPIELEVRAEIEELVDELYPLYLNVYQRSHFRFETLTPDYLVRLGKEMPDRVRFFVWRLGGAAIAFSVCLVHGDTVYDEYLGLDYSVAYDLHLYLYTLRDIVSWAMGNGYRWYCSTALSYEPKRRLRCELVPLDLYVTHTSRLANWVLRRVLPFLEPTHRDPALRAFPDYPALWGPSAAASSARGG